MTADVETLAKNSVAGLELRSISAGYGRTIVVRDVDLEVPRGSVVALLGPNGAGKTTLLRVASGLIRPKSGDVLANGMAVTGFAPHARTSKGICLIPEGRGVFRGLSVRENLQLSVPSGRTNGRVEAALDVFPVLRQRLGQPAGTLSGGQQQMVALARAFLAKPEVVLLDEVSMGLAPIVVDEIFQALGVLRDAGISLLLVEQYVTRALELADHAYLMNRGTISFSGPPSDLDADEVMRRYLGLGD